MYGGMHLGGYSECGDLLFLGRMRSLFALRRDLIDAHVWLARQSWRKQ
jgi:hypothetical protein